jgi:hypothetical protein
MVDFQTLHTDTMHMSSLFQALQRMVYFSCLFSFHKKMI